MSWFLRAARPDAARRLYVFPYAGAIPATFLSWAAALGDETELAVLCLPGRGSRHAEPPAADLRTLVMQVASALAADAGAMPYAVFGHSLGALVAFEVLRVAALMHLRLPTAFVASASAWPGAHKPDDLHLLPEPEFRARLAALGGTPPEVLADDELMALFTPVLRADFALLGGYDYRPSVRLPVPIHVFAGRNDTDILAEDLSGWFGESLAPGDLHWFDGGHFFVHEVQAEVLACLRRLLP
jgi:medium-chain acyl-[acyl-carrier-protein] hydrolase